MTRMRRQNCLTWVIALLAVLSLWQVTPAVWAGTCPGDGCTCDPVYQCSGCWGPCPCGGVPCSSCGTVCYGYLPCGGTNLCNTCDDITYCMAEDAGTCVVCKKDAATCSVKTCDAELVADRCCPNSRSQSEVGDCQSSCSTTDPDCRGNVKVCTQDGCKATTSTKGPCGNPPCEDYCSLGGAPDCGKQLSCHQDSWACCYIQCAGAGDPGGPGTPACCWDCYSSAPYAQCSPFTCLNRTCCEDSDEHGEHARCNPGGIETCPWNDPE